MSETSKKKPAAARERGRYRHVVLLGDALLEAYGSIDQRPGKFEEAVLPGTRDQWKLSVISVAEVERAGPSLALPRDATHAMIFIEGNHAIEQSGLLDSRPDTFGQTLEQLALAADEFERTLERLIHVAQAARLVIMVCAMFQPNYKDPVRQRTACAALAVFNDRVTKRAAEARVALIDLRLTCNDPGDYDKPTLLSRSGVQKVANVVRFAMFELDAGARRSEVFY
ncbi:MAG: hypothetical protein D4R74_05645 [Betaproteobacteria bacterium]|nr:MAG: hypothetical protein D4R74_05645 [Betaproteobacteria bacterium]